MCDDAPLQASEETPPDLESTPRSTLTDGQQHASPPLSPTEQRVYDLLLKRLTEQQVADQLERSPNTVHVHVRNIYRKLGVRSRQQLFDIAENKRSSGPQ